MPDPKADRALAAKRQSSVFFLSGELDMATVPIMNVAIADAVSRGGPITIDMTYLTFMDSSGVGATIGSVKTLPTGCIVGTCTERVCRPRSSRICWDTRTS